MLRKVLWFAVTSGLAAKLYRSYNEQRARTRVTTTEANPLKRWENEGGATITPATPTATTAASPTTAANAL